MRSFPFLIAFLLLGIVPFFINFLVQEDFLPYVFGEGKDWLVFFSGYLGGAMGAVVAVYVAKVQVENAKKEFQLRTENDRKVRQEENRVYTTFSRKLVNGI